MTIRIWQSYSCNNSSSFRMVARFTDAGTAKAVTEELDAFLSVHAAEVDARIAYSDDPTQASIELGKKYGFEWSDLLFWGSGPLVEDMPELFVEDNVLIVQHTYCGGGFGDGLPAFLAARGAQVQPETESGIQMSLLFQPSNDPYLDDELTTMFSQRTDPEDMTVEPLKAPWTMDKDAHGNFTFFRSPGVVGLHFPTSPRDIANVKAWLRIREIRNPVIRIDVRDDAIDFDEIGKARCRSCNGPLEYLHPGLHDIEVPQLVCRPCGGFYDLAAFLPPKKS